MRTILANQGYLRSFPRRFSFPAVRIHRSVSANAHEKKSYAQNVEDAQPPPPPAASNRQQFKQLAVHPTILRNIRTLGVGIKCNTSNNANSKTNHVSDYLQEKRHSLSSAPPAPFGKQMYPVRIVGFVDGPRKKAVLKKRQTKKVDAKDDNQKEEEESYSYDDFLWPSNSNNVPEIALVGRSNVGKSTLLNALLYTKDRSSSMLHKNNQKDGNLDRRRRHSQGTFALPKGVKATMSPRPGETKALTFYQLHGQSKKMRIVDLPGYGFAYAAEDTIQRNLAMMTHYLLSRPQLQRMLLLVDARHGMKQADIDFLQHLESHAKSRLPDVQIVLTKCDCVQQTDLARRVVQVRDQLMTDGLRREPTLHPTMFTSARELKGVIALQRDLARVAIDVVKTHQNKKTRFLQETVETQQPTRSKTEVRQRNIKPGMKKNTATEKEAQRTRQVRVT